MDHSRPIDMIQIADLTFSIEADLPICNKSMNFDAFIMDKTNCKPDCILKFISADHLKPPEGHLVGMDMKSRIIQTPNDEVYRLYHNIWDTKEKIIAFSENVRSGTYICIRYESNDALKNLNISWCFSLSSWEQMMMWHDRMILHAACVETTLGGLLFSGPSGIGKSTQAELWTGLRHARMINGDKPILYKKEDCWRAYGSPYAGSSECFVNDSVPIRAIFLLEQNPENEIRRLGLNEAFHRLFANMTVYTWDKEYVDRAVTFVTKLAGEVPIYELKCTPDEKSVILIEEYLTMDCNHSFT